MSLIVTDRHYDPGVQSAKQEGATATGQPGEIVRAVNRDNVAYRLPWDSTPHVLTPNKDEFIPWEVMSLHFGDPRALSNAQSVRDRNGVVSWLPDRGIERRRVLQKWDFDNLESPTICRRKPDRVDERGNPEKVPECANGCVVTNPKFEDYRQLKKHGVPNIEFYALDGRRILTVADDPYGDSVNTAKSTVSEQDNLRELIQKQQEQINALMKVRQVDSPAPADELSESPPGGPEPLHVQTGAGGSTEVLTPPEGEPGPPDDLPEDPH